MNKTKQKRLNKIIDLKTKRTVLLPLDHGVTDGPIPGLVNMDITITNAIKGGVDAIIIHKGIFKIFRKKISNLPVLIHISASTAMGNPLKKVIVAKPKEILDLGADGVSVHINLANQESLLVLLQ